MATHREEAEMRAVVLAGLGAATVVLLGVAGCTASHPDTGARGVTTVAVPGATPRATASTISRADAERFATAAVPDGSVVAVRLDSVDGAPGWAVRLATPTGEVDVFVDMNSGAVRADTRGAASGTATGDGPGHG